MFEANYTYGSTATECIVTCAECGSRRRYLRGEIIFKTTYKAKKDKLLGRSKSYRFCSHSCRAKWIRNKKELEKKED